ncbi:hypothetical protein AVEN_91895-1 [Araneus ventricosus]|uniref:Uncharacterized protein n=1 Tax=Araneus ventricosus TaxID=182803 RepID=A0A4Y2LRK0_ARAVE|nr:hypothetical protein AVEN_91895-1 [Araneus ventricosus]
MGIDIKLAKREERVLLRVIEQENRRAKAHHSSEIDENFMDSLEESSGTEDSDQPGLSSNIAQSSLEENINAHIDLRMGIVRGRKCFLTPKIMAVLDRFHISQRSAVFILEAVTETLGHNIDELAINPNTIQRYREDFQKAIEDFISQKSLNSLKKLNIDISFLNISPDLWDRDDSYLKSQEIFQNLRVVNDTAERGVKLMQDFNGLLTVDEEQKQFLLQCVEDHRKQYPDCKKATLKRKID